MKMVKLTSKDIIKIFEDRVKPVDYDFALTLKITKEINKLVGDIHIIELAKVEDCKVVAVLPKTVPVVIAVENAEENEIELYSFGEGGWNEELLLVRMSRYDPESIIESTINEVETIPIEKKLVELFNDVANPIDRGLVLTLLLRGEDSEVRKVFGDVKIIPFVTTYYEDEKCKLVVIIPETAPAIVSARTLDIEDQFAEKKTLRKYLELFVFEDHPYWDKSRVPI